MAVRLNPCEFDKSDVDQFLKLRDEYRGKLEDIANAKINRNRFFSSKMSGLKPHKKNSNNDAYKYHQHEESEDPNDEFSDDDIISMINVKKQDSTPKNSSKQKSQKRKLSQHVADEDVKFPKKKKKEISEHESRKSKLYH